MMVQKEEPKPIDAEIARIVKERYGKCAATGLTMPTSCCAAEVPKSSSFATAHGLYTLEDLSSVPETALGLSRGCGNPTGFAELQPGEVVVDFGCGAGIDVILAAKKVAPGGKVIGIDFVSEMIGRAKQAITEAGFCDTVELRVADLGQTSLPQGVADVVISNCVINLCADKEAVYREAFRILKPGGRLAISDIAYTEKIDPGVRDSLQSTWAGCVGGATDKDSCLGVIEDIGFADIHLVAQHLLASKELEELACCPGPEYTSPPAREHIAGAQNKVASIKFTAIKPHISE